MAWAGTHVHTLTPARPGSAKKNEDTMSEERDLIEAAAFVEMALEYAHQHGLGEVGYNPPKIMLAGASELQRLRGEVERLREGLAPYLVEVAGLADSMLSCGDYSASGALLKHLTAEASRLLSNIQGE